MNNIKVAIITSTWKRDIKIIERCIQCVQYQTFNGIIKHYICSDGPEENNVKDFILNKNKSNIMYLNTGINTNSWGAGPRQFVLDYLSNDIPDYVFHYDDDNVIFPEFIEEHISILENNKHIGFSICNIIHNGPLPSKFGQHLPQILTGIPPVYQNIDTMQAVIRYEEMKKCGWTSFSGINGYCNDGYTYDRLGKQTSYIHIPKLLGIHI